MTANTTKTTMTSKTTKATVRTGTTKASARRSDSADARGGARSYHQFCAVARGLDVIGERWTLLIVRDLLTGPKRYTDLLAGLPGIGTNLLANRLRELEEEHIVQRRVLPPPAASTVYELTEIGRGLEPVLMALGRWGHRLLDAPRDGEFLSANAYLVAMRAAFQHSAATDISQTYELHIGSQVFEVSVGNGRCTTREGQPAAADAIFTLDVKTLSELLQGELTPAAARKARRVQAEGDPNALETFTSIFALRLS